MSDDRDEIVYLEVRVKASTPRALLVVVEEDESLEEWIPRSQIHDDSDVEDKGDEGTLAIPRWLAEERDLA